MKRTALPVLIALLVGAAEAHQDRILSARADGVIPELPVAYSATRLHVTFSSAEQGSLSGLRFISSGHETNLPECLLRLVSNASAQRLFLHGSWYHNESLLPHYVSVEFRDATATPGLPEHPGLKFLFSLRDAQLLDVSKVVQLSHAAAVQHQQIGLVSGCPA
jgi:hypothetical protein